jgi:Skp family chaperone for outer membrane proteins
MNILRLLPLIVFFLCINQSHAEVKLAVIDVEKIKEESKAFTDAMAKINATAEALKKKAMKMQEEFTKKHEDLGKQKNVLSADEYNKRNEAFNKDVEKEEKAFYTQRANLDKSYRLANEILANKTTEIIAVIAKEKGFTVVFSQINTVYNDESIDITKKVVSDLNKQLKSISVN